MILPLFYEESFGRYMYLLCHIRWSPTSLVTTTLVLFEVYRVHSDCIVRSKVRVTVIKTNYCERKWEMKNGIGIHFSIIKSNFFSCWLFHKYICSVFDMLNWMNEGSNWDDFYMYHSNWAFKVVYLHIKAMINLFCCFIRIKYSQWESNPQNSFIFLIKHNKDNIDQHDHTTQIIKQWVYIPKPIYLSENRHAKLQKKRKNKRGKKLEKTRLLWISSNFSCGIQFISKVDWKITGNWLLPPVLHRFPQIPFHPPFSLSIPSSFFQSR